MALFSRLEQVAAAAVRAPAAIAIRSAMMMDVVMHVMVNVVRHMVTMGVVCPGMMMNGGRG
jgi:hypothetical protein